MENTNQNQGNKSSTGNMSGNSNMQGGAKSGQPFVERFEMAVMQFVILQKASSGDVTKENLKSAFTGNLQMKGDHFQHCIQQLIQDGHLKENGNKYTVTDDGREDVQKLQNLVIELPQIVKDNKGGQNKQGMTQQQTTGGAGNTGSSGGNTGSSGNVGGNQGANKGMGGSQSTGSTQSTGAQNTGTQNKNR